MLLNVLICVLTAYVMVSPYFYYKAVKIGLRLAEKPEKVADEPMFNLPKKKKEPVMTKSEKRTMKILENIDRYDGTSNGQEKIVNG